jgi:sugar lactone lactonase YvrE
MNINRNGQESFMNWNRWAKVVGVVAAVALHTACGPREGASMGRSSGSLTLSADDSKLFAVDTDNDLLVAIDRASLTKVGEVKVGRGPSRVLAGPNDTLFIANRLGRSISVVSQGDLVELRRLEVGIEPNGMAFTFDSRTLLVVSATAPDSATTGVLTAIDTSTFQTLWSVPVGEEPRGVTVIPGDRALVSLYKKGEIVEVDLKSRSLVSSEIGLYGAANASRVAAPPASTSTSTPRTSARSTPVSTFSPRAMADLVATPDGQRVFAPVVWAREDAIARRPTSSGGYYSGGGPCSVGAVATAGIVTVETQGAPTPAVDDLTSCASSVLPDESHPSSVLVGAPAAGSGFQGPTVGVVDPSGNWLFVVNRESSNLVVVPTNRRSGPDIALGSAVRASAPIGAGSDGVAVTKDGTTAYVYSQFDHRVETITAVGTGPSATIAATGRPLVVASDTLSPDLAEGRRMFFSATDRRLSSRSTVVACSTCHLEGREDGHVWQFPDGPRQTPSLAGRKLLSTAPYHWSGQFDTIQKFDLHTITERMGGDGLDERETNQLNTFMDQLPAAENPHQTTAEVETLARGKVAFEKAECGSCHSGALLTNNKLAVVGSASLRGLNPDNGAVLNGGFNVPSLIGVGRTAPYMHDGSGGSLEQRVNYNPDDAHGKTSKLSEEEKAELVRYLKSL